MNFINDHEYCKNCNKDLCIGCENEHKSHNIIYFGDILPNKKNMMNNLTDLRASINKLKIKIDEIIKKFKKVISNMEIYYKISNNIITGYNIQNKNFYVLQNINEFDTFNKIINNDIIEIINSNHIKNQFKAIYNIYLKMDNKYQQYKSMIYSNNINNNQFELSALSNKSYNILNNMANNESSSTKSYKKDETLSIINTTSKIKPYKKMMLLMYLIQQNQ